MCCRVHVLQCAQDAVDVWRCVRDEGAGSTHPAAAAKALALMAERVAGQLRDGLLLLAWEHSE